jgi:hypothetical protein
LADKDELPGGALLPTLGVPGSYEWCEEVAECINAAWRARETGERGFLAAVRAALQYRIWETLAPPFPQDPYGSLEGLIRRTADPGQAENMQIVIRFSGVLDQAAAGESEDPGAPASLPASGPGGVEAHASLPAASLPPLPARRLTEEEEIALGNRLLDDYAAGLAAAGIDPEQAAAIAAAGAGASSGDAGASSAPPGPRVSAAQRKRETLERKHPELMEAVQAGEITLKQAYVQAGLEKQVPTLDKLQRLWKTASGEEQERFLSWLEQEIQRRRQQEYREEVYGEDT